MANINPNQIRQIESAPNNPKAFYSALGNIVNNSSTCRAKVESINPGTGEYRITLTGTYSGAQGSEQSSEHSTQDASQQRNWEQQQQNRKDRNR
jgi:hypothetical protein